MRKDTEENPNTNTNWTPSTLPTWYKYVKVMTSTRKDTEANPNTNTSWTYSEFKDSSRVRPSPFLFCCSGKPHRQTGGPGYPPPRLWVLIVMILNQSRATQKYICSVYKIHSNLFNVISIRLKSWYLAAFFWDLMPFNGITGLFSEHSSVLFKNSRYTLGPWKTHFRLETPWNVL